MVHLRRRKRDEATEVSDDPIQLTDIAPTATTVAAASTSAAAYGGDGDSGDSHGSSRFADAFGSWSETQQRIAIVVAVIVVLLVVYFVFVRGNEKFSSILGSAPEDKKDEPKTDEWDLRKEIERLENRQSELLDTLA